MSATPAAYIFIQLSFPASSPAKASLPTVAIPAPHKKSHPTGTAFTQNPMSLSYPLSPLTIVGFLRGWAA